MKNWWPTVSKNRSHVREGGLTRKGISILLNRKTEPSFAAVVGYDRFVGEQAYRQLTELYRALRRFRQLLPALNETPIEATRWGKSALCLRFSEDPLQRLLLSEVLPAEKQQELIEVAYALDPIHLFQQAE